MYGITVTVLEWREYEPPVMIHVVKNFLSAQSIAMTYMSAEMRDCQIGVYGEPNYTNVEGIREYRWQSSDIVSTTPVDMALLPRQVIILVRCTQGTFVYHNWLCCHLYGE